MGKEEKFSGIREQYYRSGRNHIIRRPTMTDPVSLNDEILERVLYYWPDQQIKTWNLKPEEVNQWTADLASGRIPLGYVSVEGFKTYVIRKCIYSYNRLKEIQSKK